MVEVQEPKEWQNVADIHLPPGIPERGDKAVNLLCIHLCHALGIFLPASEFRIDEHRMLQTTPRFRRAEPFPAYYETAKELQHLLKRQLRLSPPPPAQLPPLPIPPEDLEQTIAALGGRYRERIFGVVPLPWGRSQRWKNIELQRRAETICLEEQSSRHWSEELERLWQWVEREWNHSDPRAENPHDRYRGISHRLLLYEQYLLGRAFAKEHRSEQLVRSYDACWENDPESIRQWLLKNPEWIRES